MTTETKDSTTAATTAMTTKRDMTPLYTPIAIVVAGVFVAGGLFLGLSRGTTAAPAAAGTAPATTADITKVTTDGAPFIGEAHAPVVMAFWSDFQCPYCKAFEVGGIPQIPTPAAMPDIIKNYVATGKLKIVFKEFPFLGKDSITAGEYEHAIWKLYPDQYFAWRTAMYQAQDEEGDKGFGNAVTIDKLITTSFAKINDALVRADIAKNKTSYDAALVADMQEGQAMGVQGTPGFVIGKTLIAGAEAYATFAKAIDAASSK
jgi:protein-disulfide isomerase